MTTVIAEVRLLSKSSAAKALGLGKEKLNKLIETGKIRFLCFDDKIRIPVMEINRFIKENMISYDNIEESKTLIRTNLHLSDNQFNSTDFFNQLREGE